MRRDPQKESWVYDVHPLDVWGNRKEGFEVNDVYPSQGTVTLHEDMTHDEIVRALKREGFIDRHVRTARVGIDGEIGYTLYLRDEKLSKPAYELRPRRDYR
jgi:hypothetical protein